VALAGYTNAGKSSLFNALTRAEVVAEDKLFATLDPTMRRIGLPGGGTAILSDTVGFISELPTALIAAFRATLEEVSQADLILHVRDIATPNSAQQKLDVEAVLAELGVDAEKHDAKIIEVWNKIDLVDEEQRHALEAQVSRSDHVPVLVSARNGEGLATLAEELSQRPGADMVAPFGTSLHVSGRDEAALEAAIAPYRERPDLTWTRSNASLEDVFIDLMSKAKDNFQ